MISTRTRFPINSYQGEGTFRGKWFQLNVITSLIWDFFQIAISLLAYVATFSGQRYVWRSYLFTLLQSNYFNTTVTFSEQLFLQSWYFFSGASQELLLRSSHFFKIATFSEQTSTEQRLLENRYFFRAGTFQNTDLFGGKTV